MWRWAPTPRRSSAGRVEANSRPARSTSAAGTPHFAGPVLDRIAPHGRKQLVIAVRVRPAPLLVVEPGVHDRAHHADRQRGVGAGQRAQVLVGHPGRAAAERVDHDEPRARRARVEELAPQVRAPSRAGSSPRRARSARAATPRDRPRARRRASSRCRCSRPSRRWCARARRRPGAFMTRALIVLPWIRPWVPM